MKLHLPITLLTAVLAAVIALPTQAVEAPKDYTTTYLNSPGTLENYSILTSSKRIAFILRRSLEITPSGADYWTYSTPLVRWGHVFFGSYNSDSPVALSFKDGNGSAFYGQDALTFDTLSNLTFSTITDDAPAISVTNGTLTITNVNDGQSDTVDVLFKDIKNTSSSGGAICAYYGDVTISQNGDVSFSGNSSYYHYFEDPSYGGAIEASTVTISRNGNVSFSGNSSSSFDDSSVGGAINASYVTISNNSDVSFSGNSSSSDSSSSYGGAIDASTVTISNNGNVSFSGNSASADSHSYGGAIYASTVTISNNSDVSFSGNSSSANAHSYGGAIYAKNGLTISHNGDVSFSGNSSYSSSYYSFGYLYPSYGGAIYASSGLTIQGNDSVLFERNYENTKGAYRLRSIYSTGGMTLSAKTGGNITFYDSVYTSGNTYINSDYTDAAGNTTSAKGDVIFSGKYAEQHLNEILEANNENRTATAEEILNSQTSELGGNVYVNGGSLQIVDGAVVKVNGDTVSIEEGSNATLAVSDAELVATNATIEVGASATLQLSNGGSVTADEISIKAGATLALGDVAMTTSAIDPMVVAYRLSSLNVINGDLTFAAGSTLVTDGSGINMAEGSILTFNATSDGEKINLVFTLGTEYSEDGLVQLFSNVDIVKFLMDGEEVDSSTTLLASDFFTGTGINENTTLHYDSTANVVYLQGVNNVVPEPTTATLSLLALAALAMRRRRK